MPGSLLGAGLALAFATLVLWAASPGQDGREGAALFTRGTAAPLRAGGLRRAQALSWWTRTPTASTGEVVTISISDSYPVDDAVAQGWADFFAGLVHGSELQLLSAYVSTPAEVQSICGSEYALGCYGSNRLFMIGEPVSGIDPKLVATHEYGHHVARNRVNAPWDAEAWGTKRWASYTGICPRVAAGTAFPGDESDYYRLNPGEAFAETYRALNEAKGGATSFIWPVVDSSFYPDAAALQAVEQDVLQPWTATSTRLVGARFSAKGKGVWTLALSTPLDGQLSLTLTLPSGGFYDLSLLGPDGRTVLARGLWSGVTEKTLAYSICGQRALFVRVVRVGRPGRLALRISEP